jgi:hypothetical protein
MKNDLSRPKSPPSKGGFLGIMSIGSSLKKAVLVESACVKRTDKRPAAVLKLIVLFSALLFSACELYFGKLGGADLYATYYPGDAGFEKILAGMSGVWYSHYGTMRLDSYRVGKFGADGAAFVSQMGANKLALFPTNGDSFVSPYPLYQGEETADYTPVPEDYFIVYDDTVYGEGDDGQGGNNGWDHLVTRYAGIVRAVNIFNGSEDEGAIIIQYFKGCCPTWSNKIKDGGLPFFGMHYRRMNKDRIQMANAVELAALYAGEEYYTETATLDESIVKNNAINSGEFISWGVVWPQDREQ